MLKIKKTSKKADSNKKELENKKMEEQKLHEKDYGDILAMWEFPEFIKHEKGKIWYISFTTVFLAMLVYSYFSDNLLFAIILVIFAVLYLSSAKNDPITMETAITEDGVFIGSKFIPYQDFRNFYIIYQPPEIKNLYFETKSVIKQRIVIPLENQNPVHLREILLEYLEEDLEKEEIPASESITEILKL